MSLRTASPLLTGWCETSTSQVGSLVGALFGCLVAIALFVLCVVLVTMYVKMVRRRKRLLRITQVKTM